MKLDKNGVIQWTKTYYVNSTSAGYGIVDIDITPQGIYCLMGEGWYAEFTKVDASGNVIWAKETSASFSSFYGYNKPQNRFTRTKNGDHLIHWGDSYGGGILRVDSLGNGLMESWGMLRTTCVLSTPDSGYLMLGNGPLFGVKYGYDHVGLIRMDSAFSNGYCTFSPAFPSTTPVIMTVTSETATSTPGALSFPFHPNITSIPVLADPGCVDFYGSVGESDGIQSDWLLSPNPSIGVFQIIRSPEPEKILGLEVINAFGARVNYFEGASALRNVIDLSDQPAGLYHFRLICIDKVYDQQIVIVK
jgi:hypothetical protein